MTPRQQALDSANHWNELANTLERRAVMEARIVGNVAAHHARAADYRAVAWALALEAETGQPHCSICFGPHPNHLHSHIG